MAAMKRTKAELHEMREGEVMRELRKSRIISVFWLQDPLTRWAALDRLKKRGVISVKTLDYPYYKVTIHKIQRTKE